MIFKKIKDYKSKYHLIISLGFFDILDIDNRGIFLHKWILKFISWGDNLAKWFSLFCSSWLIVIFAWYRTKIRWKTFWIPHSRLGTHFVDIRDIGKNGKKYKNVRLPSETVIWSTSPMTHPSIIVTQKMEDKTNEGYWKSRKMLYILDLEIGDSIVVRKKTKSFLIHRRA